jgi:phosphoribosylanthranilate isomerase
MLAEAPITQVRVAVKICGCIDVDNAVAIAEMGIDYLGVNCWPLSKRYAAPARGRDICREVRSVHGVKSPCIVGLFVNAALDDILASHQACAFDVLQLHGEEPLSYIESLRRRISDTVQIWRAVPVTPAFTWSAVHQVAGHVDGLVLDTPSLGKGGSGRTFDWTRLQSRPSLSPRVVLAGGLSAGNVADAIAIAAPDGVDVASGVEDPDSPGIKNLAMVASLLSAVRTA